MFVTETFLIFVTQLALLIAKSYCDGRTKISKKFMKVEKKTAINETLRQMELDDKVVFNLKDVSEISVRIACSRFKRNTDMVFSCSKEGLNMVVVRTK